LHASKGARWGAVEEIAGGHQRAVDEHCVLAGDVQVVVRNIGAQS
jgi:hypothetical protein